MVLQLFYSKLLWNEYCLYIAATTKGLAFVGTSESGLVELKEWHKKHLPQSSLVEADYFIVPYKEEISSYLNGMRKSFNFSIDLYGTEFQKLVWKELRNIPYGKTVSYTEIAKSIGKHKSVRAVANAIGKNPILFVVPCHRVIRKDGNLSGFRAGVRLKQMLLQLEESDDILVKA